jgi:aerobic carbon-monoxide dehydrogenase large subunit
LTDAEAPQKPEGVGARLPRKEDERLMRGLGQYVGDLRLPGIQDVAFVRSPCASRRPARPRYRGNDR